MDKKKFFERYSNMFHTSGFKATYEAYQKLSEEERKKLKSDALSEKSKAWHNEHKEEFKKAMKGHAVSEKTKAKLSESSKAYYSKQENRDKASATIRKAFEENPRDLESFRRQAQSLRQTYRNDPSLKERISSSLKAYYSNPVNKEKMRMKTKTAMQRFYETKKGQENLKKWTDGSRAKGTSKPEKDLQEFVRSLANDAVFNARDVLGDGEELDVYVPSKKVAVEYNDNIWHSEAYKKEKASQCQLKKTVLCEQKGIRLIHIFSDEWESKNAIVKSLIASSLGIYKKKLMARKLAFKKISSDIGKRFFIENHIQGNATAKAYYGLYNGIDLVQAVSIGKNRFKKDKSTYELIRMATVIDTQVVGGFSKLIKNAMKDLGISHIESYIDRRLFDGKGYRSAGFIKIGESGPRYFYTDGKKRENRQSYMKQSCLRKWPECNENMTEHEMCLMHNLYRIYDCGTVKVSFSY